MIADLVCCPQELFPKLRGADCRKKSKLFVSGRFPLKPTNTSEGRSSCCSHLRGIWWSQVIFLSNLPGTAIWPKLKAIYLGRVYGECCDGFAGFASKISFLLLLSKTLVGKLESCLFWLDRTRPNRILIASRTAVPMSPASTLIFFHLLWRSVLNHIIQEGASLLVLWKLKTKA